MNTTSRTITGGVMIVLGLALTILGFFFFVPFIYGIPMLIIGLFIFFNKKEDDIEQIKKDMNDPEIVRIIEQDLADAKTLNVQKTPGFFVNGKPLQEFGYQQLQQLIESEIRVNYPN